MKALPHINLTVHDPHSNADEEYSGVRMADILTPLGASLGKEMRGIALATFLVATGSDGYQAVLGWRKWTLPFIPGKRLWPMA